MNQNKSIIKLEKERMQWSFDTFKEATALSSLEKLSDEIEEVAHELQHGASGDQLVTEYADCLMCLFDSAGRAGVTPEQIFEAFKRKLAINKARSWEKNENNTYSHTKK